SLHSLHCCSLHCCSLHCCSLHCSSVRGPRRCMRKRVQQLLLSIPKWVLMGNSSLTGSSSSAPFVSAIFDPFAKLHRLWCKRSLFRIFAFFELSNASEMRATIDCVRGVQFTSTLSSDGLLFHSPAVPPGNVGLQTNFGVPFSFA